MTPAPNFRALCAELVDACNGTDMSVWWGALDCAEAALATPPPKPPTVMEILDLSGEIEDAGLGQIDLVRAALERWGHR